MRISVNISSNFEQMNNHKSDILNHENILHILKELEQNPAKTQRDLAQKLKVSLGKINYLLNALIDKGIVEAKNFKNSRNKLAFMYLVTPEGIKMKIQLTHKFFTWKILEYEKLRQEIECFKQDIAGFGSELI